MASYTSSDLVLGELPGAAADPLGTYLATAIATRSAFVRAALFAFPDECFPDYPASDPLVEQATRYLAAYDCAVRLKIAQRGDLSNVMAHLLEAGNGVLHDLRERRLRLTIPAAKAAYGSPILGTRNADQRTFTMENQDLWGGPSADGSAKPTGAPDGPGPWEP